MSVAERRRRGLKRRLERHPALLAALRMLRPKTWRDAAGLAPVRDYTRLLRLLEAADGAIGAPVEVRIKPLGNQRLALRPGTSDIWVLAGAITAGDHLPPAGLDPSVIWDLGCNVGVTMADFATRFPRARITGVEPSPDAAALARENVRPWRDRCRIVEAAVWTADGTLGLQVEPGFEHGARLAESAGSAVRTFALETLLREEAWIDYLKVDIEGAESAVLARGGEWASKVGCIKVETHAPYTPVACAAALERLGFSVTFDPAPGSRHITGSR